MNPLPRNPIPSSGCQLDVANYKGWKARRLANGILELFVVPEIVGRILQLRSGKADYFFVNPRHLGRTYAPAENNFDCGWINYGGRKVWPTPQGWPDDSRWPVSPREKSWGRLMVQRLAEKAIRILPTAPSGSMPF